MLSLRKIFQLRIVAPITDQNGSRPARQRFDPDEKVRNEGDARQATNDIVGRRLDRTI